MTVYYLGLQQSQAPTRANVSEATSAPTADFILEIGAKVTATKVSRTAAARACLAFVDYLLSDGAPQNGSAVLPLAP